MPHSRARHIKPLVEKSLRFWPVVCIVGSRQVGKSTLMKGLTRFHYHTLDDTGLAELANRNPSGILDPPCAIDEAQKAPKIFDAVKLDVDRQKKPGKYVLTGSVRFSSRTLIRESLTGRAKTLQMFPLTCSESLGLAFENRWQEPPAKPRVTRKDFQRYLARGGMPAIFAARNAAETASYWNALIESYVYRDLLLAVPKNPRPSVALAALKAIAEILALGELPTFSRILKKTGGSRTLLERHLIGMEDMMIVHRLGHLGASRTKDIFLPFDPAFFLTLLQLDSPSHDAAVHVGCMQIALVNEALAHAQASDRSLDLKYAVSPSGETIHLVTQGKKNKPVFWKISEEAVPHAYSLRFLEALGSRHGGTIRILSSTEAALKAGSALAVPWESVL